MTDHPGWIRPDGIDGAVYRPVDIDGTATLIIATRYDDGGVVIDSGGHHIRVDTIDPHTLQGPDDLVAALRAAGTVVRMANPWLWDAIATAIMRQVTEDDDVRRRYQRLCRAFGEPVTRNGATAWLFPAPERILRLTDTQYYQARAKLHQSMLRAAARCYLQHGKRWQALPAGDLTTALRTEGRIDERAARAAVADFTGDFAYYPCDDLLQSAVQNLNPQWIWPQSPPMFTTAWEQATGKQRAQWTTLALAGAFTHADTEAA